MKKINFILALASLLFTSVFLTACQPQAVSQNIPIQRESPQITIERILVVCLAQEPESLYPLDQQIAAQPILDTIYDGPIDKLNYELQPVILTEIPSLSDGSAALQTIMISEGETIVDTYGNLTQLTAGTEYRPAGCQGNDCAVVYEGGEIEISRMIVKFNWRTDIFWSDGTPLTASDSVFGYQLSKAPESPSDIWEHNR